VAKWASTNEERINPEPACSLMSMLSEIQWFLRSLLLFIVMSMTVAGIDRSECIGGSEKTGKLHTTRTVPAKKEGKGECGAQSHPSERSFRN